MKLAMRKFRWIPLMVALMSCWAGDARSQILTDVPDGAKAIRVDEKLGETVPLDLVFINERGEPTSLRKFCDGQRPWLLTLNYSSCPGLCVAQLNGLAEGVAELSGLSLGKDFDMVAISIDPRETPEKAAQMKARYVSMLSKEHDPRGWHFLTGDAKSIEKIADAVGFHYTYDAKADRFNHGSVAIGISPHGKVTRYLYSVAFPPETLRLALVEASEGRIGTTADQILLWCFHYNPDENRYSADARRLLSFAAGAFVLIGLGASAPFWFSRRQKAATADTADQVD
jgi:protein SCO1/2